MRGSPSITSSTTATRRRCCRSAPRSPHARSHIRIGTFLLLLPLHNPVRVAEDTATRGPDLRGRFDLGVGLGYRPAEFDDQGIPVRERAGRMQEGLTIVRQLLSGESVRSTASTTACATSGSRRPRCSSRIRPSGWADQHRRRSSGRRRMGFHFLSGGPGSAEVYDNALASTGVTRGLQRRRDDTDLCRAHAGAGVGNRRRVRCTTWHPAICSGRRRPRTPGGAELAALPSVDEIVAQAVDGLLRGGPARRQPSGRHRADRGIPLTLAADPPGVRRWRYRGCRCTRSVPGWSFSLKRSSRRFRG